MGWATFWAIFSQTHLVTLEKPFPIEHFHNVTHTRVCIFWHFVEKAVKGCVERVKMNSYKMYLSRERLQLRVWVVGAVESLLHRRLANRIDSKHPPSLFSTLDNC
jgi:hypothetical protein